MHDGSNPFSASIDTWEAAVTRWLLEGKHRAAATRRREKGILEWLAPRLQQTRLDQIGRVLLDEVRAEKLAEGAGPRSANYVVGVVLAVLRAAADRGWIDKAPTIRPLKLPPPRVRWLTVLQASALLAELPQPLRDMASLSLETGLRWGNVSGLRWAQVHEQSAVLTISAGHMKGRSGISLPLSEPALEILRRRRGQHAVYVFAAQGRRIQRPPHEAWYGALRRAGIDDFRWHDLRHTWASWHAQQGTPMLILQQLGGWKTPAMVTRYAHLDTRALRGHVAGLAQWKSETFAQSQAATPAADANPPNGDI